jgi:hypothetical protein
MIDEFEVYMRSSPHNSRAVELLDLDESIAFWRAGCEDDSNQLVAENLLVVAEALSLDNFAVAAAALEPLIDGAILETAVLQALATERIAMLASAARQADGDLPAPRKPFDKKADKLPNSPSNKLLKAGDYTARSRLNSMRNRINEALRKGDLDGQEIHVWGLSATIIGDPRSSYVPLTFTRKVGDASTITFTTRQMLTNYEPAILYALYSLVPEPTVDDLMALMIMAFDNGMMEEAGKAAAKVRAATELDAELDEILSAKWITEIPEGGFPERNGSIVPE